MDHDESIHPQSAAAEWVSPSALRDHAGISTKRLWTFIRARQIPLTRGRHGLRMHISDAELLLGDIRAYQGRDAAG